MVPSPASAASCSFSFLTVSIRTSFLLHAPLQLCREQVSREWNCSSVLGMRSGGHGATFRRSWNSADNCCSGSARGHLHTLTWPLQLYLLLCQSNRSLQRYLSMYCSTVHFFLQVMSLTLFLIHLKTVTIVHCVLKKRCNWIECVKIRWWVIFTTAGDASLFDWSSIWYIYTTSTDDCTAINLSL